MRFTDVRVRVGTAHTYRIAERGRTRLRYSEQGAIVFKLIFKYLISVPRRFSRIILERFPVDTGLNKYFYGFILYFSRSRWHYERFFAIYELKPVQSVVPALGSNVPCTILFATTVFSNNAVPPWMTRKKKHVPGQSPCPWHQIRFFRVNDEINTINWCNTLGL